LTENTGLTDDAAVRERLLADRTATAAQAEALRRDLQGVFAAATDVATDDEHDPEGTTIAFERAQVTALLDRAQRRIVELDEALDRLDAGRYGICVGCGEPIAPDRLDARPSARTCIVCATRGVT
jgi:RNA polymerase-binding transcription factor DksA